MAAITIFNAVAARASCNQGSAGPCCFASPEPDKPRLGSLLGGLSRRDTIFLSTGGLAYAKLLGDVLFRLSRGDAYPPEHEDRVRSTFRTAIVEAARSAADRDGQTKRPLRVLEVGVGPRCRVASQGLYGAAMDDVLLLGSTREGEQGAAFPISWVELVGIDLTAPSADAVNGAREALSRPDGCVLPWFRVTFDACEGDLTAGLPYASGSFDCVLSALTLCSVADQEKALEEIHRLVNPRGGTFGYVEHVAVRLDEEAETGRKWLDWQQRTLDPLQQLVADNCHLHRDTDLGIRNEFRVGEGTKLLANERFFVDDMWPVSCQCAGVVQMLG